jgi:hypothetical protein
VARFAGALLLEAWLGIASAASTSGGFTVDANAEFAAVLYAASATQAALSKSVDARLRSQQERITALAAEMKAGDSRHRVEMIAAQEAFVAELAAKDRECAAQIGVFRSAVTDIASSTEGASALVRFNAGDEVGAISILDRLRAMRPGGPCLFLSVPKRGAKAWISVTRILPYLPPPLPVPSLRPREGQWVTGTITSQRRLHVVTVGCSAGSRLAVGFARGAHLTVHVLVYQ